ncbi:MAG: DUF6174 domain-containing protein [Gemmatimonadaceae bacterium]
MTRIWSVRIASVLPLVGMLSMSGCGIVEPLHDESSELSYNWERWITRGYSSYDFIVEHDCYCVMGGVPVEVSVRDGHVVDVVEADTGRPLPTNLAVLYRDIDGLFQVIDDAIARRAHSIDARYDGTYGFPTNVYIDYSYNTADEEFGFRIQAFYPIR